MSSHWSWPKRVTMSIAALALASTSSFLLPSSALGAQVGGNNGTVKICDQQSCASTDSTDKSNANDPKLTCPITIEWDGFDPAPGVDQFDVTFTGVQPTNGTVTVVGGTNPDSGSFTGPSFKKQYSLQIDGGKPHSKTQYHVKIEVDTTTTNGQTDNKFKTVWLDGCASSNPTPTVSVSGSCNTATHVYDWSVDTTPPGAVSGTWTKHGAVSPNGTFSTSMPGGTGSFSSGTENDLDLAVTTNGWSLDSAEVTATPDPACAAAPQANAPDISIDKTGTSAAFVGDPVSYPITITVANGANNGPTTSTTTVSDTLPQGFTGGSMTYTSGTGSADATTAGDWTCSATSCHTNANILLQPGDTVTFTVSATAGGTGTKRDTATVTTAGDSNSANNTDTQDTVVTAPTNLTLTASCSATPGQITWTITNPLHNASVTSLAVSNGTNVPGTLNGGDSTTFPTSAPQNTALTVTATTTPGHQSVSSNPLAFTGSCTTPGNPNETPAHVDFSSTCTGIHAVFTTASLHSTQFDVTTPTGGSDTVTGSGMRDYAANPAHSHLSVAYDGATQTYDWTKPAGCAGPGGVADPGATASNDCISGITVVLSDMNGGAPETFTVTGPDGSAQTVPVNAGQVKKVVYAVTEDTTGVVHVTAPGFAKTFSYAKNCTKVLGEKKVHHPKPPTKVEGEKSQLPFTGFDAKASLFDAACLFALGAIVCGLASGRRRRFAPQHKA